MLAVLASILFVVAFANISDPDLASNHASINPGPLSHVHAEFTSENGCRSCHGDAHETLPGQIAALLQPATLTESCESCHQFGSRSRMPHNALFPERSDLGPIECVACHQEHHGDDELTRALSDQQCGTACHQQPFSDFAAAHPPFPERFPSGEPGTIRFDHLRHFKRHFPQSFRGADPAVISRASQCTSCHQVEEATRRVSPASYDRICASCHERQITGIQVTLAYVDEPTALTALLTGTGLDDDRAEEAHADLLEGLAEDGSDYLEEVLSDSPSLNSPTANKVIEHFEEFPLDEVAEAWMEEDTIEVTNANGLSADDEAIYYRLSGHADPFARAMVELSVIGLNGSRNEDERAAALEVINALASDDEGTTCGKCHVLGAASGGLEASWNYAGAAKRPLTRYSHGPHINLLGLQESCDSCHRINPDADYQGYFKEMAASLQPPEEHYQSNFHPILVENCSGCHNPRAVSDSCTTCHDYHQNATISAGAITAMTVDSNNKNARHPASPNQADSSPESARKTEESP
ncbi:MAG: hypothetical protein VW985_08575 [Gammaproteobacteria bacterium]